MSLTVCAVSGASAKYTELPPVGGRNAEDGVPYRGFRNMDYPTRKLHRLQTWDYSAPGYYFITICTKEKRCVLSSITDGQLRLTRIGAIAEKCWLRMNTVAPHITTDYYCVMPNHIHGIVVIGQHPPEAARSIPDLIHAYKSTVTREVNRLVPPEQRNQLWQSSYYDEIIRTEQMLLETRRYIEDNPRKWAEDDLFTYI